jgi:hypothetical protein
LRTSLGILFSHGSGSIPQDVALDVFRVLALPN